jgi:hypothetical protein
MLNINMSVRNFVSEASLDRTDRAEERNDACRTKNTRERLSEDIFEHLIVLFQVMDMITCHQSIMNGQPGLGACPSAGSSSKPWRPPALPSLIHFSKSRRPRSWRSKTSGSQGRHTLTSEQGSFPSASPLGLATPPRLGPYWQTTGSGPMILTLALTRRVEQYRPSMWCGFTTRAATYLSPGERTALSSTVHKGSWERSWM